MLSRTRLMEAYRMQDQDFLITTEFIKNGYKLN